MSTPKLSNVNFNLPLSGLLCPSGPDPGSAANQTPLSISCSHLTGSLAQM